MRFSPGRVPAVSMRGGAIRSSRHGGRRQCPPGESVMGNELESTLKELARGEIRAPSLSKVGLAENIDTPRRRSFPLASRASDERAR